MKSDFQHLKTGRNVCRLAQHDGGRAKLVVAQGNRTFDGTGRQDVRGCSVKLSAERAPVDPKVFTKIHMHFVVTGRGLAVGVVERAINMSHDKYCSATIMLAKTAEITTTFEVIEV